MTAFEARTRRAAERHLAELYDRFETVPVREDVVVNDPDFFEHGVRAAERGRLASAGAWVTDDRGRLLLVRPAGVEQWGPPAGTREPGETLVETARRETFEESGVPVELVGVRRVRKKTVVHAERPDRRLVMVEAYFEAEPAGGDGEPGTGVDGSGEPDAAADVGAAPDATWNGSPSPDPTRSEAGEAIAEARWFAEPPDAVADGFADGVREWARD